MTRARTRFGATTWNAAAGNPCARPKANDITAMTAIARFTGGRKRRADGERQRQAEPAIATLSDGVLVAPCGQSVHPPAADQDAGRAEHEQDAPYTAPTRAMLQPCTRIMNAGAHDR